MTEILSAVFSGYLYGLRSSPNSIQSLTNATNNLSLNSSTGSLLSDGMVNGRTAVANGSNKA